MLRIGPLRWLGIVSVFAVLGFALYACSASSDRTESSFTVGTAILVAGYLIFPVLGLLAAGFLLIALLLFLAHLVERRRLRP